MGGTESGWRPGPVRGLCGGRAALVLALAVSALASSGVVAREESAYQSFYTPLFSQPVDDPCAGQRISPSGGLVARRQPALQANDVPRAIALMSAVLPEPGDRRADPAPVCEDHRQPAVRGRWSAGSAA
jgi:hypothetical protein